MAKNDPPGYWDEYERFGVGLSYELHDDGTSDIDRFIMDVNGRNIAMVGHADDPQLGAHVGRFIVNACNAHHHLATRVEKATEEVAALKAEVARVKRLLYNTEVRAEKAEMALESQLAYMDQLHADADERTNTMKPKKWLCGKCGNELGIALPSDRLRFGMTEGSLPVQAKCKCGFWNNLDSFEACDGPDTDDPGPLVGN
jgi:hypothetical protein